MKFHTSFASGRADTRNLTMNCPLCHSGRSRLYHRDAIRDYRQCLRCRLVFVPASQRLDPAAEKERYDQHRNDPSDPRYRKFLSRLYNRVCRRIDPPARGLDFGSGPGPALATMFRESGYSMRIYDIYYAEHPEVLELEYDFITCSEAAEHLYEPGRVLQKLLACLASGGILAVMTQMVIDRERFASWHYIRDPTHVGFFSRETFSWFAERHNCGIEFTDKDIVLLTKAAVPA